jgi:hypothetical protein
MVVMVPAMAMAMTMTTDMKVNTGAIPVEVATALAVPMATMAVAAPVNLANGARALRGRAVFGGYAADRCSARRRSHHGKSNGHSRRNQ